MKFEMKNGRYDIPNLRDLSDPQKYLTLEKYKLYLDLEHYRLYRFNGVRNKFLKPIGRGERGYTSWKTRNGSVYLSKLIKDYNIELIDPSLIYFDNYKVYLLEQGLIDVVEE